ncbi:MAG TPA: hypothetical protein VIF57_27025 [Polyangia bacterium]|jgi:hypothetical protein
MSPLAPFRKWIVRATVVVALVVTLPLVGLRGVAHADLGDEPSSKSSSSSSGDLNQVEDNDKPKDLLEKKPADAAVEQKKQAPVAGPAFYEKWQFWAIAIGVVVGAVALIWGGQALAHQINGGDVRPCNMMFQDRCFGEGR